MWNLAQVKPVPQDLEESAAGVGCTTRASARAADPNLALHTALIEVCFQLLHAAEFEVEPVNLANMIGFLFVDD